jgi:hypothetical protein
MGQQVHISDNIYICMPEDINVALYNMEPTGQQT